MIQTLLSKVFPKKPAVPHPDSVLLITLDSLRFDTFLSVQTPNLDRVAPFHKAHAPSYFTYGSHKAIFMGFTPGVRAPMPFLNPKREKLFRMQGSPWAHRDTRGFSLAGENILQGFRKLEYAVVGAGAVPWFDPETETGQDLIRDFDQFHYAGNCWGLPGQLEWLGRTLEGVSGNPVFCFLNIGETHVPYYHEGAEWSPEDNPCVPFSENNSREKCVQRQAACLRYADALLRPLLGAFLPATILACGDHGDCWGEDGLWEHGMHHEKTLEVPLAIRLRGHPVEAA